MELKDGKLVLKFVISTVDLFQNDFLLVLIVIILLIENNNKIIPVEIDGNRISIISHNRL